MMAALPNSAYKQDCVVLQVRASRSRKRQAGVSLVELLIVMAMTAVLASALSFAFSAEVTTQRHFETREATVDRTDTMEREITRLLQGARLSASAATTPATGATGGTTGTTTGGTTTGGTTGTSTATTYFISTTDAGEGTGQGSNRITFTTTAPGIPMSAVYNTNDSQDFNTEQQDIGPVGGLAEVSLGTAPVGDAGGRNGLFERMQRPSDADYTQGGMEWDLDPDITSIGFEFWDGEEWESGWDTTSGTAELPEAVQVSFTLTGDPPNTVHVFTVPIPASTVSAQNPATGTGTATQ